MLICVCHCPLWDSPGRAQTAQLSLALCYPWGGGGRWYLQPRSWGQCSFSTQNLCPAACPGRSSASGSCVHHSQSPHGSAAQPEVCYGSYCKEYSKPGWTSVGLSLSFTTITKKKRQAACGILPVRGTAVPQHYIPHPPPRATAKLSTENLERVGQNQNHPSAGHGYRAEQPSKSPPGGNSCCSMLPGTIARSRTAESSVTHHQSVHARSCASFPIASHTDLQSPEEWQEQPARGDRHPGDHSV